MLGSIVSYDKQLNKITYHHIKSHLKELYIHDFLI